MPTYSRVYLNRKKEIEHSLESVEDAIRFRCHANRVELESHALKPGIHGGKKPDGTRLYAKPIGQYHIGGYKHRVWALYSLDPHMAICWEDYETLIQRV